jgi:general stress protein YciG
MASNPPKSGRGFASMDPARQREIASQGGRAAHASGNAHEFTSEEARRAGQKSNGGQRAQARNAQKGQQAASTGSGSARPGESASQGGQEKNNPQA